MKCKQKMENVNKKQSSKMLTKKSTLKSEMCKT